MIFVHAVACFFMFCYYYYSQVYLSIYIRVNVWYYCFSLNYFLLCTRLYFFFATHSYCIPHTHTPYTTSLCRLLGWPLRWIAHSSRVFWWQDPISFWFWPAGMLEASTRRERDLPLWHRFAEGSGLSPLPDADAPGEDSARRLYAGGRPGGARDWLMDTSVSNYWGCVVVPTSTSSQLRLFNVWLFIEDKLSIYVDQVGARVRTVLSVWVRVDEWHTCISSLSVLPHAACSL